MNKIDDGKIIMNNRKKEKKGFVWKYIKPFFFSTSNGDPDDKDRIKPIYFWATLFLFLTFIE